MNDIRYILLGLLCHPALAVTTTENFSTTDQFDATSISTATWNTVSKSVVLPPFVTAPTFSPAAPTQTTGTFSISTGADGPFNASTYANFDIDVAPTTVTLDTSRQYHFTTITVDAGITVLGSGTQPLQLFAQGDVTISGTINLSGGDGGAITADSSLSAAGGTACCGGAAGGAGGSTAAVSVNGTSADTGDTGKGLLGTASGGSSAGSNGGGGGAFGAAGTAGRDPNAVFGGSGGSANGDAHLSTLTGGSGGGGGGHYNFDGAGDRGNGGGGGGGGGSLQLFTGGNVLINATGRIDASGGDGGGDGGAGRKPGGGGGGSGGAILIFSQGRYINDGPGAGPPAVDARAGLGGSTTGGNGGNGSVGRVRIVTSENVLDWFVGGTEDPVPPFEDFGVVKFSADEDFFVFSNSYDTGKPSPRYDTLIADATIPSTATVGLAIAGSSDDFASDNTGFVADLSLLNGKRYFKFRITLNTTDQDSTPEVRSVSVSYIEPINLDFSVQGCARITPTSHPTQPLGFAALFLFLLLIPRLARFLHRPFRG